MTGGHTDSVALRINYPGMVARRPWIVHTKETQAAPTSSANKPLGLPFGLARRRETDRDSDDDCRHVGEAKRGRGRFKAYDTQVAVSELSLKSVYVTPIFNLYDEHGNPGTEVERLASATGFVILHKKKTYLITNWHVVSGRDPRTGQALDKHAATPTKIEVWFVHIGAGNVTAWTPWEFELVDDKGTPLWLEHAIHHRKVDAVALPVEIPEHLTPLPYTLASPQGQSMVLRAEVSDWVNIIGFPFGKSSAGYFAIWVKGAIASDMEIDHDQLPCFLIDSRTRPGQSGSPVVAYAPAGPAILGNGSLVEQSVPLVRILGVYSGRINEQSDIGYVWKTSAIEEILENGVEGDVSVT